MTTTTPAPDTTATTAPTLDTGEMLVIHSLFRREVRLAAGLVRGVEQGDTRRAALVGAHLDVIDRALHHHHVTEDDLLWPLLLDRAADDSATVVHLMERQHHDIAALLAEITPLQAQWVTSGDRAGDDLAERYERLTAVLTEHLDAEESLVLPLAARHLDQAEWDALGEAGRTGSDKADRSLVFGMMMYDGDPELVARMLASAPVPVRKIVPWMARRAYARHATLGYGTPTP